VGGGSLAIRDAGGLLYRLAGGDITISNCRFPVSVCLVDPISGRRSAEVPVTRRSRDTLTIELDGRQRLGWVEVDIANQH
jgi:hypothetical protein